MAAALVAHQIKVSVESMNKLVKRILGTLLTERRLAGDNPNWTEVLGLVSAYDGVYPVPKQTSQ